MRRIHSTYLGRATIPRDLTDLEMREFFTLTAADRRALRRAIRTRLRLAVALQVGFLRMTGTTLDAFDYVPRRLFEFLGKQVGRPAPMLATLRGLYRRRLSLFRHQSWALERLGMHRFGGDDEASIIDALASETRSRLRAGQRGTQSPMSVRRTHGAQPLRSTGHRKRDLKRCPVLSMDGELAVELFGERRDQLQPHGRTTSEIERRRQAHPIVRD